MRLIATLGSLIDQLDAIDDDTDVSLGLLSPHSYRGYYDQLGFAVVDNALGAWTVRDQRLLLRGCLGETFKGYKGGDYRMGRDTPCWRSHWGTTHGAQRLSDWVIVPGETPEVRITFSDYKEEWE